MNLNRKKWETIRHEVSQIHLQYQLIKALDQSTLRRAIFSIYRVFCHGQLVMAIGRLMAILKRCDPDGIGEAATDTLKTLFELYDRNWSKDHNAVDFRDCGLRAYRDKVVAHPTAIFKALRDEPEPKISLHSTTIDQTVELINRFCDEVGAHHEDDWATTWANRVAGVEEMVRCAEIDQEMARKYHELSRDVSIAGRMTVTMDYSTRSIVPVDTDGIMS